jgi:hypothetical protein
MRLSIVFFSSRTSSGEPLSPLLLLPPAGFDRSVAFSLRSRSISPLFFFWQKFWNVSVPAFWFYENFRLGH